MKRRPVCLVCLLLMLCLYVTDLAGISMISGNPLPASVQKYISEHLKLTVNGEVQSCQATENSLSVYLKQVFLTVGSEQIPIENIKVYFFYFYTILDFINRIYRLPTGRGIR